LAQQKRHFGFAMLDEARHTEHCLQQPQLPMTVRLSNRIERENRPRRAGEPIIAAL